MAPSFRYRFIDFATVFTGDSRLRGVNSPVESPGTLFSNELATDVGGTCLGANEPLAVIDHHFSCEGQFPSASAAVLHKAQLIRDRFAQPEFDVLWLVTHRQPDFDAFCSMYLARWIIENSHAPIDWASYGLHPEGWLNPPDGPTKKIDWLNPDLSHVPPEHRWPLLLASFASLLDSRRRISCPRQRALHSILDAALKRGRDYLSDTSGAMEFFDEARASILQKHLNPIFDSVLEGSALFAPELAMLDRESEAYERDLRRARASIVYLPQSEAPSPNFFKRPNDVAPLQENIATPDANAEHLLLADTFRIPTSAIYLRDPESLLFQEWARLDVEHSRSARALSSPQSLLPTVAPPPASTTPTTFFPLIPSAPMGGISTPYGRACKPKRWKRCEDRSSNPTRLSLSACPRSRQAGRNRHPSCRSLVRRTEQPRHRGPHSNPRHRNRASRRAQRSARRCHRRRSSHRA